MKYPLIRPSAVFGSIFQLYPYQKLTFAKHFLNMSTLIRINIILYTYIHTYIHTYMHTYAHFSFFPTDMRDTW